MSLHTISTLQFITRENLASLIRSKSASFAVIDVRDSDYIGGLIAGGTNVPVNTHD